jgi:CheY-like chemotaxis protein
MMGWPMTCYRQGYLARGKVTSSPIAILCIDDDEGVLYFLRTILERSGYKTLTATSGRQGLKLATHSKFDLVVLDYEMPGMNGHEVASVMKNLRPDLKVVLISGSDVPSHALTSVDAFVDKVETSRQLLPIIAELCGQQAEE